MPTYLRVDDDVRLASLREFCAHNAIPYVEVSAHPGMVLNEERKRHSDKIKTALLKAKRDGKRLRE